MNNISCDVIQDLMPVYIEHMCSTESRKLVEAHMAECEGCRQVFRAYTDETIVREVSRTEAHAEGKENEFHQILKNVENKVIKRVAVIAVIIVSFSAAIGIINFMQSFCQFEDTVVHVTASEEKDRIDIDTAQVRLHEDVVDDSIVLTGRYSLAARRSYEKSGQRYRYEKSLENKKKSAGVIYRGADGTETVLWEK